MITISDETVSSETGVELGELQDEARAATLDDLARTFLGVSGPEFERRWQAGDYQGVDLPEVSRVAALLE